MLSNLENGVEYSHSKELFVIVLPSYQAINVDTIKVKNPTTNYIMYLNIFHPPSKFQSLPKRLKILSFGIDVSILQGSLTLLNNNSLFNS